MRYTGDFHIPVIKIGSCRTHHLWEQLLKPEEVCNYRRLGYMTLNELQQTIEQLFVYTDNKITCDVLHLEIPTLRVYNKHALHQEPRGRFIEHGRDVNEWSDWMYRSQVGVMAGYDYHKYKMSKTVFEKYFDNIMRIIPDDIHVVVQTSLNIQLCDSHADEIREHLNRPVGVGDLNIAEQAKPILTQDNRFVDREKCDDYIHHSVAKYVNRVTLIDIKDIFGSRKSDVLTGIGDDGKRNFAHYTPLAKQSVINYVTNNLGHLLNKQ